MILGHTVSYWGAQKLHIFILILLNYMEFYALKLGYMVEVMSV